MNRKVIVCTMYSPCFQALADVAIPNMEDYCRRHRYESRQIIVPDNDAWFKKHEAFERYFNELEEGDIIWYRDIDGLIMNMNKPIADFIDNEISFFITNDFSELNGGSIIIKNNPSARFINKYILSEREGWGNEQNVYNSPAFYFFCRKGIKVLPQNTINSYSYDLYTECKEYIGKHDLGDYKEGDLFIHFPGLSPENKLAMMLEYKDKIIYE